MVTASKQLSHRKSGQMGRKVDNLTMGVVSADTSEDLDEESVDSDDEGKLGMNLKFQSKKNSSKFSREMLFTCSSHGSYMSEYSKDYDSDPSMFVDSDDDIDGLEGVLQMGCMDMFFLPSKAKTKTKRKSLIKLNKKGEKELNLKVKGPLALGLEAQMKKDAERFDLDGTKSFSTVLQDTITACGTPRELYNNSRGDTTKESEFDQFKSLMSLSHASSSSSSYDDDCGNSEIPENQILPPPSSQPSQKEPSHPKPDLRNAPRHHQQQYQRQRVHEHHHRQESSSATSNSQYGKIVNGRMPEDRNTNKQNHMKKASQKQSGKPAEVMPSQILVRKQRSFEDESCLSCEVNMAPDPPQSSALLRLEEDDYPDTSSEEGSSSSMEARGSMFSGDHGKEASQNMVERHFSSKIKTKEEEMFPKVERWREANLQRLKQTQQHLPQQAKAEVTSGNGGGESVGSDQATYSSTTSSQPQTTVPSKQLAGTRELRKSKKKISAPEPDGNKYTVEKPTVTKEKKKLDPEATTQMAFDSIFTRRIEKRRAAKLKANDKPEGEQRSADLEKSDSTAARKDSTKTSTPTQNKSRRSLTISVERNDLPLETKSHQVTKNYSSSSGKASSHNDVTTASRGKKTKNRRDRKSLKPIPVKANSPTRALVKQNAAEASHSPRASLVIEAAAAAAAHALKIELTSVENDSFDVEDTENQAPTPTPLVKGSNDDIVTPTFLRKTKSLDKNENEKESNEGTYVRRKNPFQDDDIFDGDDIYDDDEQDYPLLTKSSSDHDDLFIPRPMVPSPRDPAIHSRSTIRLSPMGGGGGNFASGVSSPLSSRRAAPPMTPSPRHSLSRRGIVSPRNHGTPSNGSVYSSARRKTTNATTPGSTTSSYIWNDTTVVEYLDRRMASNSLENNPSDCDGTEYDEFFEANMYTN